MYRLCFHSIKALSDGRACKIYFFFQIPIKVRGASRSKIIVNKRNLSQQLIQQLPLCLQMRCRSLDRSYILFKWLNMCFTEPSSQLKIEFFICGRWFPIAISTQVQKSDYWGTPLFIQLSETTVPIVHTVQGRSNQLIHPEGWPQQLLLQLLSDLSLLFPINIFSVVDKIIIVFFEKLIYSTAFFAVKEKMGKKEGTNIPGKAKSWCTYP